LFSDLAAPSALGVRSAPAARGTATGRPTTLDSEVAGTDARPDPAETRTSLRSPACNTWPALTERVSASTRVVSLALSDTTANMSANPTTRNTPSTIHGTCLRRVSATDERNCG